MLYSAHPCAPPFGRCACVSLQATVNSQQRQKSNQKNAARPVCPSGPRGIRLCLRVVLTRRPGSTGLNQASCLIFPTQAECLGKLHGETIPPVKLAEACSLDGAQRNPGIFSDIERPRIYRTLPCVLPFGPARGCSNSIPSNLVTSLHPGYDPDPLFTINC